MGYFFIYKTTLKNSEKYYVGRHYTEILEDGYFGSGKWVRSIKDKSSLSREIIAFYDTEKELIAAELSIIEENIGKPNCMNFNNRPVGFASGKLNPNSQEGMSEILSERTRGKKNGMFGRKHTDESKEHLRNIMSGDNNPAKRPEVREKISKNVSAARKGIKYSEEGKKKLSESRKREYAEGKRSVPQFERTEEYRDKIRQKISGTKWYNDGIKDFRCTINDEIQSNWVPGRLWKKSKK